jgi:hypothetical protein
MAQGPRMLSVRAPLAVAVDAPLIEATSTRAPLPINPLGPVALDADAAKLTVASGVVWVRLARVKSAELMMPAPLASELMFDIP